MKTLLRSALFLCAIVAVSAEAKRCFKPAKCRKVNVVVCAQGAKNAKIAEQTARKNCVKKCIAVCKNAKLGKNGKNCRGYRR